MGTHRLRRTLARVSVVSLCAVGVVPLSSGTAHAAPPSPRLFDATALGMGAAETFEAICTAYDTAAGADMTPPSPAEQALFAADNGLTVQFDDAPLPPLGLLSDITLVSSLVGPPLLFGLGGSLLGLEIVDQASALDVTLPSSEDNMIIAGDGDNVILGGSGNDYICGGVGGDIIDAGSGDNEIIGGSGEDVILAFSGNDNAITDPDDLLCYLGGGTNAGC